VCVVLIFLRIEVESDDDECQRYCFGDGFDGLLTAQSDCLNQGMCRQFFKIFWWGGRILVGRKLG
jgi:hypothetical protein